MRAAMDIRPSRLLLGAGALGLAFSIGIGVASGGSGTAPAAAAPAAPALAADDVTAASSALGLGDATLVAAVGLDGTTGDANAAAPKGAGLLRAIIGRTQRAEITVATADGQKTLLFVRGSFSAASPTSVTVTLKDGTTALFGLDSTTTVRSAGKAKAISDIKTTGRGVVLGVKNADGSYTARFVRIAPAS
jgi:hypothetical protein